MKIAIVAPKIYPVLKQSAVDSFGGAEVALGHVACELSRIADFDVHALVGDYGQPDRERVGDITLHRSLVSNRGGLRNAIRFTATLNAVHADVYVQRSLAVASAVIALFCRIRRRRFVYWVAHDREADGGHPLQKNKLTSPLMKLVFKLASHVIVQNDYEYDQLMQRFPGIRCTVIKKGMELPAETPESANRYDAIWVGRCDEWKNPEAFVELARLHGAYRFLMICPPAMGKEDFHRKITVAASACENLEMRGRTGHLEVLELMANSRVFCLTSSQEGDWPRVVLEAASLRKPVLSLELDYQGLISEFGGGRCCDGDASRFAGEFENMMKDEDLRKQLGNGAYDYVRDVHDTGKQTARLVALFNDLA